METIGLISVVGIIGNISNTSQKINDIINYFRADSTNGTDESMIEKFIVDNDIELTIKSIDQFTKDVKITDESPKSLIMGMENILKIVEEIELELKEIKFKLEWNKNRYFFRLPYRFENSKNRMKTLLEKLEIRKRFLFSMFSLKNSLNTEETKKGVSLFRSNVK